MSYDAGINYEEAFSQVRTWDALIFNHLRKRNIVIPPLNETIKSEKYPGGYVKDIPEKGISADWIVSFDLNSLYPHLIMQYNISPETLREDLPQFTTQSDYPVTEMLDGVLLPDLDKHDDIVMAASGYMFSGKVRGFLPELMEKMYDERVDAKDKMISYADISAKDKKGSTFKAITRGGWTFFRSYILLFGWLDGWTGFRVAQLCAKGTYLRYTFASKE